MNRLSIAVSLISVAVMLTCSLAARAQVEYIVIGNTALINGTQGWVDLEFNPGGSDSLPATVSLTNFSGSGYSIDTSIGPIATDGSASYDQTSGSGTINNTQFFNDILVPVDYGGSFSFDATFTGSALHPTPPIPSSGSTFGLTLYDTNFNPLLTSDPSGVVFAVNINPDGSDSGYAAPYLTPSFHAVSFQRLTPSAPVPEPGALSILIALAILGIPVTIIQLRSKASTRTLLNG